MSDKSKTEELAKGRLLCPKTFNHPDDGDYCYRERCAWFDRLWNTCAVLSEGTWRAELLTQLQNIAREMQELRAELQRVRGAIPQR